MLQLSQANSVSFRRWLRLTVVCVIAVSASPSMLLAETESDKGSDVPASDSSWLGEGQPFAMPAARVKSAADESNQEQAEPTKRDKTHQQTTVHEFELKNGLRLLVRPDPRAPVVVSQIWYRVGGSFEPVGQTGVSHVLEHMMFKGTDRFAAGELSDLVAQYGGMENAFTARDYTGYFQIWEKSRLPLSFAIEANRMQHLQIDPAEFEKEKRVVMEERRLRTDDSPGGTAYERLNAAAFVASPYRGPIIGWMHDIENLTVAQAQAWYMARYAPNNAIVVVAGDVDPEAVHQLAKTHFGDIEKKELPTLPDYSEVEQKGKKHLVVMDEVKVPQLTLGFVVPSIKTATDSLDVMALSMLAAVLDGGLSARFETELIRKQAVAASIGTSYDPFARGDVLFAIQATPNQGVELAELEQQILEQIYQLQQTPPKQSEIDRALVQLRANEVYSEDSISQQASRLGQLAVIDVDWRMAQQWVELLAKVTPADVQRVAEEFLQSKRLTVVELVPESTPELVADSAVNTKPKASAKSKSTASPAQKSTQRSKGGSSSDAAANPSAEPVE